MSHIIEVVCPNCGGESPTKDELQKMDARSGERLGSICRMCDNTHTVEVIEESKETVHWFLTKRGIPSEEDLQEWVDKGYIPLLQEVASSGLRITREFDLSEYPSGYDEGDMAEWCKTYQFWCLVEGPNAEKDEWLIVEALR